MKRLALFVVVLMGFVNSSFAYPVKEPFCNPDSLRQGVLDLLLKSGSLEGNRTALGNSANCVLESNQRLNPIDSGIVYLSLGEYNKAVTQFDRVIMSTSNVTVRSSAFFFRANCYFGMSQSPAVLGIGKEADTSYVLGMKSLDSAAVYGFDLATIWLILANASYAQSEFDSALVYYDSAIANRRDFPEAWRCRAVTLRRLRRNQDALWSVDSALVYQHNYAEAWVTKGACVASVSGIEKALPYYDTALFYQHDLHEAWVNKSIFSNITKQYQQALSNADSALTYRRFAFGETNLSRVWINRGLALWRLGRCKEAVNSCDSALFYDPSSAGAASIRDSANACIRRQ
jgi:tetratricopeptide (TPR) repeat protein